MSKFQQTVERLLAGDFVCEYSSPELHRYLADESSQREVNELLGKLNRRVASTPTGAGFYCAYIEVRPQDRDGVRSGYEDIVRNLRYWVAFLDSMAKITGSESFQLAGTPLSVLSVAKACEENEALYDELKDVAMKFSARSSEQKAHALVKSLFEKIQRMGYLHLRDPGKEVYVMTSRVEMIQPVINFVIEHNQIDDQTTAIEQKGLFT